MASDVSKPGAVGPSGVPRVGAAKLDAMSTVLARNWWLVALRGLVAVLFGAIAIAAPGAFVLSLVLFFAAYMLIDGCVTVVASVRAARHHERWGFLLLEGLERLTERARIGWAGVGGYGSSASAR